MLLYSCSLQLSNVSPDTAQPQHQANPPVNLEVLWFLLNSSSALEPEIPSDLPAEYQQIKAT